MKKFGNLLWGILFIAVGLILALNYMGVTNINLFFEGWWTLFIIVPCFIGLFTNHAKTWDIIGLLIGIALFCGVRGYMSFATIRHLALPVIFIIIGCSILFSGLISKTVGKKMTELNKNINDKNANEYYATFSEQKVDLQNEEFRGADLNAVFGSASLNLNQAIIKGDQIVNASAIFGGITIFVPQNVNIKIRSTPIFGGVSNKTARSNTPDNAMTIYINAFCLFGGVEIR